MLRQATSLLRSLQRQYEELVNSVPATARAEAGVARPPWACLHDQAFLDSDLPRALIPFDVANGGFVDCNDSYARLIQFDRDYLITRCKISDAFTTVNFQRLVNSAPLLQAVDALQFVNIPAYRGQVLLEVLSWLEYEEVPDPEAPWDPARNRRVPKYIQMCHLNARRLPAIVPPPAVLPYAVPKSFRTSRTGAPEAYSDPVLQAQVVTAALAAMVLASPNAIKPSGTPASSPVSSASPLPAALMPNGGGSVSLTLTPQGAMAADGSARAVAAIDLTSCAPVRPEMHVSPAASSLTDSGMSLTATSSEEGPVKRARIAEPDQQLPAGVPAVTTSLLMEKWSAIDRSAALPATSSLSFGAPMTEPMFGGMAGQTLLSMTVSAAVPPSPVTSWRSTTWDSESEFTSSVDHGAASMVLGGDGRAIVSDLLLPAPALTVDGDHSVHANSGYPASVNALPVWTMAPHSVNAAAPANVNYSHRFISTAALSQPQLMVTCAAAPYPQYGLGPAVPPLTASSHGQLNPASACDAETAHLRYH